MSYRDLRNLAEMLRALGYQRLVSIENFRNPNFPLVADIARWLILQYDPRADMAYVGTGGGETEGDRVHLVRAFAEFMLVNVQVKLNTKRLYQADGYAVKELLKVTTLLYIALNNATANRPRNLAESIIQKVDPSTLTTTRSLSSTLLQKGATLYDLLSKEMGLREARQAALSKAYERTEVEKLIRSAIAIGGQEMKKMESVVDTIQNNLTNVESKFENKRMEMERNEKRLQTLKKVRPAFMDEYEELEGALAAVYTEYVNRFHSLAHVTEQIEKIDRLEEERRTEDRLAKAASNQDDLLPYKFARDSDSSTDEESEMTMNLIKTAHAIRANGGIMMPVPQPTVRQIVASTSSKDVRAKSRRLHGGGMLESEDDDESEMMLIDDDGDDDEDGLLDETHHDSVPEGHLNGVIKKDRPMTVHDADLNGGPHLSGGKHHHPEDRARAASKMRVSERNNNNAI